MCPDLAEKYKILTHEDLDQVDAATPYDADPSIMLEEILLRAKQRIEALKESLAQVQDNTKSN